jgi:hypothetical protein
MDFLRKRKSAENKKFNKLLSVFSFEIFPSPPKEELHTKTDFVSS